MDNHLLSFIPENIDLIKSIDIIVDLDPKIPPNTTRIFPLNNVNTHIFKPKFYSDDTKLYIYAPSLDVAVQTQEAIKSYCQRENMADIPYILYSTDVEDNYRKLLSNLAPNKDVIVGRYYSSVKFFYALAISKYLSYRKALNFLLSFNSAEFKFRNQSQINSNFINEVIESTLTKEEIELINSKVTFEHVIDNTFLKGGHVTFDQRTFTLLQRPWGYQLTKEFALYLKRQTQVEHITFIGGCAGLHSEMEIDEIVIPTSYSSQEQSRTVWNNVKIMNKFETNEFLFNDIDSTTKVHLCPLHSVKSSLYIEGLYEKLSSTGVGAVDMEVTTFLTILGKSKSVSPIFYIMDLPIKNIKLGDTYYNYDFLLKLSEKDIRGNMMCYYIAYRNLINA